MKYVEASHTNEVLKDTTTADAKRRATERMGKICESAREASLAAYAPQEARNTVANPGMPDATYGEA